MFNVSILHIIYYYKGPAEGIFKQQVPHTKIATTGLIRLSKVPKVSVVDSLSVLHGIIFINIIEHET